MKKLVILCLLLGTLCCTALFSSCTGWRSAATTAGKGTSTTPADSSSTVNDTSTQNTAGESSTETTSADTSSTEVTSQTEPDGTTQTPTTSEEPEEKYLSVSLPATEIYTGSLIQVNAQNPYCYKVASLYTPTELDRLSSSELAELGWVSLYTNKTGNYLLRSRLIFMKNEAFSAFTLMMSQFTAKTNHKDVQVRFAYQLVNSTTDAVSLSDERVTGLVVEVNVYTDEGTFSIDHASKKSSYYDWFAANCYNYGFIMSGESGYFRYVGVPHATYMHQNGLSLGDYLARVKLYTLSNPLPVVDKDGVLWSVYYVPASSSSLTEVKIKENAAYVISGNNRDGFIVASHDKG